MRHGVRHCSTCVELTKPVPSDTKVQKKSTSTRRPLRGTHSCNIDEWGHLIDASRRLCIDILNSQFLEVFPFTRRRDGCSNRC